MKTLHTLFALVLLASCGGEDEKTSDIETSVSTTETVENQEKIDSISVDEQITQPGLFQEYHPNGALKMEGKHDENGLRTGLWISYYENGIKWSESYYIKGKKSGHSLSFFPNGAVRYVGEYLDDQKVGTWKFYDENGELTNEETF